MCEGVDQQWPKCNEDEQERTAGGEPGNSHPHCLDAARWRPVWRLQDTHGRVSSLYERPVMIWCIVSGHIGIINGVRSPSASRRAVEPIPLTIRQLARYASSCSFSPSNAAARATASESRLRPRI